MAARQISCSDSFQSVNTRNYLTKSEESAVITAVENTDGFLDILSAVHKLKAQNMYQYLLTQVLIINCSDKENILRFIYELSAFVSFSNLVGILHFVGFEDLAIRLTNNVGETCREIGYAELSGSMPILQDFLYKQKSRLDDNVFHCRKDYLQSQFNKLILEIRDLVDRDAAQVYVDKIATVTWLRVQQCEKSADIKELINKMMTSIPCTLNKTLPHLVYKSKLAIAYELDGDNDTAKTLLGEACAISELYSHPLMEAFLYHDTRYIHQLSFRRNQSEENRRKVQAVCVKAIDFFSVFENDFCRYMKRLFCLYLVHNILKVGQNFETDVSNEISTEEIARADAILSCLERCFQSGLPLEIRRKMIYLILRTRMHELGGEVRLASSYFIQADSLKDDGTFFGIEEKHLFDFKNRLLPIPAL